ncbi:MAG: glycerophosphodiester phosphodiesterase [Acutalibacteraceae bacterium]
MKKEKSKAKKKIILSVCLTVFVAAMITAIAFGVKIYAVNKDYNSGNFNFSENFTVTAHTGSMDTAENSLESIEKAIEVGADIVEFDVRFRPDGTAVMAHDEVKTNDGGMPIEEAMKLLSKDGVNIKVNLDVKEMTCLEEIQNLVQKYQMSERVFFTGVSQELVPIVQEKCPEISYYLNCAPKKNKLDDEQYQAELLDLLKQTGAVGINCNYKKSNGCLAKLLHENGYLLSVWTVDSVFQMKKAIISEADNITTRNPDLLIDLVNCKRESDNET